MAGYAVAGWAGLAVVAVATAAIAMVVLRVLLPQATPDQARKAREKARGPDAERLLAPPVRRADRDRQPGLLRRRAAAGAGARPGRPALGASRRQLVPGQTVRGPEHLLRQIQRDAELWPWVDPASGAAGPLTLMSQTYGIPPRILARLLERLEQL